VQYERADVPNVSLGAELSGLGLGTRGSFGYALRRGLFAALTLDVSYVSSLSADGNLKRVTALIRYGAALELDWFPDPQGGLHVLTGFGYLGMRVQARELADESLNGLLWTVGLGYDWWVHDHATLGVIARVDVGTGTHGRRDGHSTMMMVAPILAVGLTYD
jgi:hypothetical protein